MITFSKLKLEIATGAFVGVKKQDGTYTFYLPKGYESAVEKFQEDPDFKKETFFKYYQLMLKYKQKNPKQRDGLDEGEGKGGESEKHPIFYDNLNIENLLNNFEDTAILGFNTKMAPSEDVDYSKIGEYLHDAYFDKNHAPIVTEITKPSNVVEISPQDIVHMYCFIYRDIKKQFQEEIAEYIKTLSHAFTDKYLSPNASFFDKSAEMTYNICKDALETIEKQTTIKSPEYELFYDAIYKFLYATTDEDGIVMGIENFHAIWEDLCFDYMFKNNEDEILFADYEKKANCFNRMYCKEHAEDDYPFVLAFGEDKRELFPDLVCYKPIFFYTQRTGSPYNFNSEPKEKLELYISENLEELKIKECYILLASALRDSEEYIRFQLIQYKKHDQQEDQFKLITWSVEIDKENEEDGNPDQEEVNFYAKKHFRHSELLSYILENVDEINKEEILGKVLENDKNYNAKINASNYDKLQEALIRLDNLSPKDQSSKDKLKYLKKKIIEEINIQLWLDEPNENILDLIDFKYKTKEDITKADIGKQKLYAVALKNNPKNMFVLPKYEDGEHKDNLVIETNSDFTTQDRVKINDISIEYWNIGKLLNDYIKD
ncbi:hypothetical protein MLC52_05210 [Sulfurimonas sp. NW15]|uniref:hypothetical protein n=1 Tax=Sulfurimonas sp. NW15 TaxID=2922729 RepID=UPI003DA94F03